MEQTLQIGSVGISIILTILLKMLYNTFKIPKKAKPWIAVFIGMGLAAVVMLVNSVVFDAGNIATYAVQGFMVGATAVGVNELTKNKVK